MTYSLTFSFMFVMFMARAAILTVSHSKEELLHYKDYNTRPSAANKIVHASEKPVPAEQLHRTNCNTGNKGHNIPSEKPNPTKEQLHYKDYNTAGRTLTPYKGYGIPSEKKKPTKEQLHYKEYNNTKDYYYNIPSEKPFPGFSIRGSNHFYQLRFTCDKYPRVCQGRGSPGQDCCNKRCVDLVRDRWNCGKCGVMCKFGETCCEGKCVSPFFNKNHCGGCNRKCKKGGSCFYGMCNYA